jgi:outer membrane protein TolC
MIKKQISCLWLLFSLAGGMQAQATVLRLADCRQKAVAHNKELRIATEKERIAYYEKKEAFLMYFPKLSFNGAYTHFSDNLHLISSSALSGIPTSITVPDLTQFGLPQFIPAGTEIPFSAGQTIKDELNKAATVDLSDIWVGGFALVQPVFAGGKIVAANQIRSYAQELAKSQADTKLADIIVEVDQAYWQVVSLSSKKQLAQSYVALLAKISKDLDVMVKEGVATKADKLSVDVKLNEAEMALLKVENGLSLSKMLLCQLCGIEISDQLTVADENVSQVSPDDYSADMVTIDQAIDNRSEVRSLTLAEKIYKKKEKVAFAEFLPTVGFTAGYAWTNPNAFDGLEYKMKGMWNVGVVATVPLNFLTSSAKYNAARSETVIKRLELDEAKEKIRLQINQSTFKLSEAAKKLQSAEKNIEKADENLRYAQVGFEEGVVPASDALAAHTAWIQAHSELIDAQIELKLCRVYLDKAVGKKLAGADFSPRKQ